jgi:hypothetical protein
MKMQGPLTYVLIGSVVIGSQGCINRSPVTGLSEWSCPNGAIGRL